MLLVSKSGFIRIIKSMRKTKTGKRLVFLGNSNKEMYVNDSDDYRKVVKNISEAEEIMRSWFSDDLTGDTK
jgi:hypothetical protein